MEPISQNNILEGTFLGSKYFNPDYLFNQAFNFFRGVGTEVNFGAVWYLYKATLFFLSLFFISVICYSIVRLFEIRKKEHEHLKHEIAEYAHHKAEYERHLQEQAGGSKNERWSKTLNYLFSQHSSDWKLAIIEADTILDGLMSQLGFQGETLGDKLKAANQNTFPQLTSAWEVHTIRNRIAHEGLNFELTHHEAKRTIAIYEDIFTAYGYI